MDPDLPLQRKWTFRARGRQVVFVKKPKEGTQHVLMKAFLWALYLPDYPNLAVEVSVGGRYKPDVVAFGEGGKPVFWGEAGEVGVRKLEALARRHRDVHIAIGKWGARLDPYVALVERARAGVDRRAPIDLLRFPEDSPKRFVGPDGAIRLSHADLEWRRLG